MDEIYIPKGESETDNVILGNFVLSTIFTPPYSTPSVVYIYGSPDGVNFGPIIKDGNFLKFNLSKNFQTIVFDSTIFEGIENFKLHMDLPASETLVFDIYKKN